MSRRMLLLAVALIVFVGATFFTQSYLSARLAANSANQVARATVPVLVAAQALPTGATVTAPMLRWAPWPVDAAAGLIVASTPDPVAALVGAVVRVAMVAGEPVTAERLVQPGARGALATILAPGLRGVTIAVTPASGMAGFVVPGDHVDLILTQIRTSDGVERHVSQTVLRDIRVLGTDQRASSSTGSAVAPAADAEGAAASAASLGSLGNETSAAPATVTLEVDPRGAELIAVSAELGKLSLSLRPLAHDPVAVVGPRHTWDVDATQLPPTPPPPRATPVVATNSPAIAPRLPFGMDVVRGVQTAEVKP